MQAPESGGSKESDENPACIVQLDPAKVKVGSNRAPPQSLIKEHVNRPTAHNGSGMRALKSRLVVFTDPKKSKKAGPVT